jgi:ATP-dependent helicase HepA
MIAFLLAIDNIPNLNTHMPTFKTGQRWISETEPELGLGRIVSVDFGRVEVEYPASDERRIYASDHAPLKRVRYHVGDRVTGSGGKEFVVEAISEDGGCLIYSGEGNTLHESELEDSQTFDKPEARLSSGHTDSWKAFDLRLSTHQQRARLESSPERGMLGGRIDLIPHQLYIASEVSRRDVPRVLLADEVGLGKTIEACLILHRMLITGKISRALILVPDPLVHQWFVELLRRFSLSFTLFNESRCAAIEDEDETINPFNQEHLIICGMDFLSRHRDRAAQAVEAGWDLLIVDEAHHLEWSPESPSTGYQIVEALARVTPGVLLLTATPEQLGPESHFARLRLLDPHRYPDLKRYLAEHKQYEAVVKKTNKLIESGNEKGLQDLLDRHGPGRVMFRNTRAAMPGFPKRILHQWPLKAGRVQDHRANWLADFLRKNPDIKVLVITQTKEEVMALQKELQKLITVNTALFHEDMPMIQCDRQAAWFAEKDGARLLIASEIGGEGRNFQFVQHLVLIHVPDDPEMLEQRIGRLDRIGQSGDIHIHVPFLEGSPEADRVRWYHEGLNAFEEALSGSHEIMLKFRDRLEKVNDALIAETKIFRLDLKKKIENGRDRLLELNSCRPAAAGAITGEIARIDEDAALEHFLVPLFDHFGVNPEHLQRRDYLLQRSHLFDAAFPLREEPLHITYDRKLALVREDITFMSWDHPMVNGSIDLLLGSESGNAAIAIAPGFKGVMLQAVFILECVAPRKLELARFLPPTPIDIIVGETTTRPKKLLEPPAWKVIELQPLIRSLLPPLLAEARKRAEKESPLIVDRARREAVSLIGDEIKRLQELQKINDHIRDDEIDAADNRLSRVSSALVEAKLRLDAIMLIHGE